MKMSKSVFEMNYMPELELLANETFTRLAEQLAKHPKTLQVKQGKIKSATHNLAYVAFNLDSPWDEAPYEDDFKDLNGKEFEILNKKFTLDIEERFLKKCSSITFSFILQAESAKTNTD